MMIVWGYRLLYLEIGIFLLVSMFYYDYPPTLWFTAAILAFFYVAQVWKNAKFDDDSSMDVE